MAFQFNHQSLLILATGFPCSTLATMPKYRFHTWLTAVLWFCLPRLGLGDQLAFLDAILISSHPDATFEQDKSFSKRALGTRMYKEPELASFPLAALPVVNTVPRCLQLQQVTKVNLKSSRAGSPLENLCPSLIIAVTEHSPCAKPCSEHCT